MGLKVTSIKKGQNKLFQIIMYVSLLAYQVVVADPEELGSSAADWDYSAGPWEVAGRRESEVAGMHLYTRTFAIEPNVIILLLQLSLVSFFFLLRQYASHVKDV